MARGEKTNDALGLRAVTNETATLGLPSNIEAEQALLGVVLCENAALHSAADLIKAPHFYEPFHQRLWAQMDRLIRVGRLADIPTLINAFGSDPAFDDLGGVQYLADLVSRAPPTANAPHYAAAVVEVANRRSLIHLAREIEAGAWDSSVSTDALTDLGARGLSELHAGNSAVRVVGADEAMDAVLDTIDNPGNHPDGVYTGLSSLDEMLGPWLPGDLIAVGGRPGMGKSAIAGIIGKNIACGGGGVMEAHAEMTVQQAWRRRLTATAFEIYADQAPAYSSIRKRTVTYDQRAMLGKAREVLRGIPLVAVKRTGITLGRLRSLALHQKAKWDRQEIPFRLLTIDHGGLIKADREYSSRVDQQTAISNGLKEMAEDLAIPILVLLQLSRKTEDRDDKRPTLSDLRDSGSWEQDADVVIGAYREAYYAQREKEPNSQTTKGQSDWAAWDQRRRSPWIDAILLKVREGNLGTAKLWGNMATNTILGAAPSDDFGGMI